MLLAYPNPEAPEIPVTAGMLTVDYLPNRGALRGPNPLTRDLHDVAAGLVELAIEIEADFVVPMSEAAVIPVGITNTKLGLSGVQTLDALVCTDRETQRTRLEPLGMNPQWIVLNAAVPLEPLGFEYPVVVKGRGSSRSRGVRIVGSQEGLQPAMDELASEAEHTRVKGWVSGGADYVVEAFITGEQYEVSGVAGRAGVIKRFDPLHQSWDPEGERIESYQVAPEKNSALWDVMDAVVQQLGLSWCAVNIEARETMGIWKIIEVHCRPGIDKPERYGNLMTPGESFEAVVAQTLWRAWRSEG